MDLGSISAAFSSLKAASDLAKGLVSLNTTTEVQRRVIELNEKIIEAHQLILLAQATQAALVDRVRDLEREIARMKDWEGQKQRYKLAAPFPGCMVYAVQKSMSNGETPHYLCTSCFQKGEPSILQGKTIGTAGISLGNASYFCPVCETEAFTQWTHVPAPQYFEDITPYE